MKLWQLIEYNRNIFLQKLCIKSGREKRGKRGKRKCSAA